ncbi:MAG TPA: alpha/beta fold hydrolase [Gemmatimonadaceae bacterium]|nr:alpha/beta fold hydrolase [Gemmatimonadaceae bacterium]
MTTVGAERFEIPGTGARVIRGEVRIAPNALGSVVLVHGFKGFARFAFFPWLADQLVAAGFTALTFNFSGSGVGEDMETFTDPEAFAENSYTRELQDLSLVLAESERRGWTGPQFGLFGHSRGGAVALLHAARDARVRALVTWASIASVVRWTEAQMAEWRERGHLDVPNTRTGQLFQLSTTLLEETGEHALGRLNLRVAAATLLCPWLIVHGDADETIPFAEGEQLLAASEQRATLVRVAGGTHTFNVAHGMTTPSPQLREATDATVRFFTERLAPRS